MSQRKVTCRCQIVWPIGLMKQGNGSSQKHSPSMVKQYRKPGLITRKVYSEETHCVVCPQAMAHTRTSVIYNLKLLYTMVKLKKGVRLKKNKWTKTSKLLEHLLLWVTCRRTTHLQAVITPSNLEEQHGSHIMAVDIFSSW